MTQNLKDVNYEQSVKYNLNYEYHCEDQGCDSEGICRCSTIDNTYVEDVDVSALSEEVYDIYFPSGKATERQNKINLILFDTGKLIDLYCIDRILRSYKIWDQKNWNINIIGGYYGEEIGSVTLTIDVANDIQRDIDHAISLDNLKDKIDFLLIKEYGYIIPDLKNKRYRIEEIDKNLIVFGNENHYKKVSSQNYSYYSDKLYKSIRGIVRKNDGKYNILDGYHRIYSSQKESICLIIAY